MYIDEANCKYNSRKSETPWDDFMERAAGVTLVTFTLGEEIIVGIAVSLASTAIARVLGWVLQNQILAACRALSSIHAIMCLWLLTIALLVVWLVVQFTGLQRDMSLA